MKYPTPTLKEVIEKIRNSNKYKNFEMVQQSRVIIAAAWIKFMVSDSVFVTRREECLQIARNHKNHIEFNGLLLDIIETY